MQEVKRLLRLFPVVILLGQRQVGKTTMAKDIAKEMGGDYLNMRLVVTNRMLDTQGLRRHVEQTGKQLTVLDEIQVRADVFPDLMDVVDDRRYRGVGNGSFLLLGSASLSLSNKSKETLRGRIAYVDLDPIDITEITVPDEIDKLWLRGGLPNFFVANSDGESFESHLNNVNNLIKEELREQGLRAAPEKIYDILFQLAKMHGDFLNIKEIAEVLDLDRRVVDQCIGLLCDLLVTRKIPAYSKSQVKNINKRPKIFYRDSGMAHYLLGWDSQASLAKDSRQVGLSWESFAIENILRHTDFRIYPSYYRSKTGVEIDLVLKSNLRGVWAIEIKKGSPDASAGFYRALQHIESNRSFLVHGNFDMTRCRDKQGIEILSLLDMCREVAKATQKNDK